MYNRFSSVIVPVYNGATFVAAAIESILAQSLKPTEIIVVDDGSTDGSAEVLRQFGGRIRYHLQENGGTSVARNAGVALSGGDFLAFLDADDLWHEDKLALQFAAFDENPQLDLVWGHVVEFHGCHRTGEGAAKPLPGHHPGTMLIRRQAFYKVGLFSRAYQQTEVVEWMTRAMASQLNYCMLADTLMYRRLHSANKGLSNAAAGPEYLHVLKRHLDRTREV